MSRRRWSAPTRTVAVDIHRSPSAATVSARADGSLTSDRASRGLGDGSSNVGIVKTLRVEVLINAAAGSVDDVAALADQLSAAFAAAGAVAQVIAGDPSELAERVRRDDLGGPDVFAVAGGDGTVNAVLAAALAADVVVAPLPLGTFNHFAKDLGIPDDLDAAAAAIVGGRERRVDVGEVNGELFINNSALGVYPEMVAVRDRLRAGRGWGKVRAVPVAVVDVLRRLRVHHLDLGGRTAGGDAVARSRLRTPMVFVGNGRYVTRPGGSATREALDGALLQVTVATVATRRGLLRVAVMALLRGAETAGDVEQLELTECTISTRAARLRVARDGEIGWMPTPLRYRCRPGALRVRAPLTASDDGV